MMREPLPTAERTPLPASLYLLDARDLFPFLRRALRENDKHEARLVYEELKGRGIYLNRADYGKYKRLMAVE